jgi:hypothetical protein
VVVGDFVLLGAIAAAEAAGIPVVVLMHTVPSRPVSGVPPYGPGRLRGLSRPCAMPLDAPSLIASMSATAGRLSSEPGHCWACPIFARPSSNTTRRRACSC